MFGAELSLDLTGRQTGRPDPEGRHLLVLARDAEGYGRLSSIISTAQLRGGRRAARSTTRPGWPTRITVTGGVHRLPQGLGAGGVTRHGPTAAETELNKLIEMFGPDNVVVELVDHDQPLDDARNDALFDLAGRAGVGVVATNNVHYAAPVDAPLAQMLAAVRARSSLDDMTGWLPANGTAHLRSGTEMAARLARFPGVREATVALARECVFDFRVVALDLPDRAVGEGHTDASWLRYLCCQGGLDAVRPARHPDDEAGLPAARPRARCHRAAGFPRLLPHRARDHPLLR